MQLYQNAHSSNEEKNLKVSTKLVKQSKSTLVCKKDDEKEKINTKPAKSSQSMQYERKRNREE